MRIGNKQYWLFQLCGWGSFALIFLFFTWTFDKMQTVKERETFFGQIGIFIFIGLVLTHIMRMSIIRLNILQKKLEKQVWQFIILTLIFAFIGSSLHIGLLINLKLLTKSQEDLMNQKNVYLLILNNAFSVFIYYFIWNAVYFMYHYVAKSQKQQLETLQLETLVKELELKTIKAHINPHFIFNSLNSIRALVDENPERARSGITELSTILRSSMQADKSESVILEKELNIVRNYLALENMRFEDRLKIEYEVDDNTLDLSVPPMMLQTLVENAIKHGISRQIHGGVVKISSKLKNNFHHLSVQNTGYLNGYTNGQMPALDPLGRGFGLSSTTNRLSLLYGNKAKFEIRQVTPTLVEATVLIPLEANH